MQRSIVGAAIGIEPIKFLQDKPVASAEYGPVLNWFPPLLKLTLPDIVRSPRSPSYLTLLCSREGMRTGHRHEFYFLKTGRITGAKVPATA